MPAAVADLSAWAKLRFTGPDRKKFLHGLLTNDVLGLRPGEGQLDCVLTAKGKLVGDLALYDRGEDLVALAFAPLGDAVRAALGRSIILSATTMEDASRAFGLTLFTGAGAAEALSGMLDGALPGENGPAAGSWRCADAACDGASYTVLTYPRFREPAWLLLWPEAQRARVDGALRAAESRGALARLSSSEFEALRIDAGIPIVGVDTDADAFPAEANLDSAISYDKGCYMGQEITSRIKNLGHVNRRLAVLGLEAPAEPGAAVTVRGAEAGKVSSVQRLGSGRAVALAMMKSEFAEPGTEVAAGPGARGSVQDGGSRAGARG
ncbi:MAG: folate-binding protein YgfZ [Elusimicrobia bacterium]|nr:folate-binding protein YgfZ [Elusimicrobiota bacterium]